MDSRACSAWTGSAPPLELPRDDPKPKLPPLELPKDNGIKLPPLELPKDDPKPPEERIDFAAERKAAEMVIRNKGRVGVLTAAGVSAARLASLLFGMTRTHSCAEPMSASIS